MTSVDEKKEAYTDGVHPTATGGLFSVKSVREGADVAAEMPGALSEDPIDPKMERRLKWKADIYICSMLGFIYAIQFADKVSNSTASIMGLIEDLEMHGKMYRWVGSSFYLGFLVFQIPVSQCLQRLPLAKTTGVFIVAWGLILTCMSAVHNYPSLIALRVLLGATEGAITPSFVLLTSQWYLRNEQFSRTCLWYGWVGLGDIFIDGVGYGLYTNNSLPMSAWRLQFIVLGVITMAAGIVFFFHVPDTPAKAWFFNEEERVAMVKRIRRNQQGFGSHIVKKYQIIEAFKDYHTYLYFATVLILQVPNGGITNFNAIIINNMGYSVADSLLMDMPSGGFQFVGQLAVAVGIMYFLTNYRMIWALFLGAWNILSLCLLAWGPNNVSRLMGYYMWALCGPAIYACLLSCISSNSAGHTKKVTTGVVLMVGYCVGNLIGPQTFKPSEDPKYTTAVSTMAACSVVAFFLLLVILLANMWENKRRDKKNEKLPANILNPEFADLTDFENPEFRYAL